MRLELARRSAWAGGLCALLASVSACVDGSPVGPSDRVETTLLLAPKFNLPGGVANADASFTRARLTIRDAATGEPYGGAEVELDPEADAWSLPVEFELPESADVSVVVLIELLSVIDGVEVVQWSGTAGPLDVEPGDQAQEIQQVPLFRGPTDNLGVTDVRLGGVPASVIEGDAFRVSASVEGGGAAPTIYFGSLDPSVASVDADGRVITRERGSARIVAVVGPRADTAVVEVRAWQPEGAAAAAIELGLRDAADRIAPRLGGDAEAATTLRGLLSSIRSALSEGLGLTAHEAAAEARARLAAYGGGGAAARADGPELSVVGLVLDHVERILASARR